jgi:hypothetical protein
MNKSDLAKLVREVLEEVMNEMMNEGPVKQINKAKKNAAIAGVGHQHGQGVDKFRAQQRGQEYKPSATGKSSYTDKQATVMGRAITNNRTIKKPGDTWTTKSGKKAKKTQDGTVTYSENTTSLRDIILVMVENKENRINLLKLTAIMEKMLPELTKPQSTKLTELCAEVHTLAGQLNTLPITIYNHEPWKVLKVAMMAKLMEVKTEVEKLKEDTPHVKQFIKALDEVILY